MLDPPHKARLEEVRRRIELASDDPKVLNRDGRTSWRGPRVRRAVERRADDGPALVNYIRGVLRKRESEGWNTLREADRLQSSFEDMVANPPDPRIAAVRRALEELQLSRSERYPLGNREDFDLEDMNEDPRPRGYRALHIDGSVTVRVAGRDFTVPFEVQVKTLAQHVFGQHTHAEAYVPTRRMGTRATSWSGSFSRRSPSN